MASEEHLPCGHGTRIDAVLVQVTSKAGRPDNAMDRWSNYPHNRPVRQPFLTSANLVPKRLET
jgi:hypothetical protein